MAAHGLQERRNTLAKLKTINGGRAWQGSVDDEAIIPRHTEDGSVMAYAVITFGAPVKTKRDRNLTNSELGQPHVLGATIACVAGDPDDAQDLMADVIELLVDWKPSESADAYEAKGGFGSRRPATENVPTRYIEGLYLETTVNQGVDWDHSVQN
ncbi:MULTISPECIES: hypothetical protein [unclassified Microbacterium]|uniref:hypothetical protein n=1 Tax=unclassified Microbacterium TaxID=2609290 RepID=UPI000EA958FD|nr:MULTISPECIES: hypothetical protein [unclassified Microbacterium]MBT2484861.1 hypothetical protein [Microbacterium sp. ISL-108]RKN67731.1 hypothetical protein D7252_09090 [Microbacterium sp. CGR2]